MVMGWGMLQQPIPDAVPPDPTQRVLSWGGAYPCLRFIMHSGPRAQCGGLMIPQRRCVRIDGKLWRKFKCNKKPCSREAMDWKVQ